MSAIPLVGPDGKEYELDNQDPAALDEALRQGFKQPVAPVEKSTLAEVGDEIGTGAVGVAQGLTGGLFGLAASKNPELRQFIEAQKEQNPTAYMAGDIAGSIVSPISKIAGGVEGAVGATSALGRIAAKGLGGAAVGALYGAGNAASDAALGSQELTAEKLMAGAGLGSVLGAGGGLLGGFIDEGAKLVMPALGRVVGKAQSALSDLADNQAIKATRAQQSVINTLGDDEVAKIAKVLRDRGHLGPLSSPDDILKSVAKDKQAIGAGIGKVVEDAEAAGARPAFDAFRARLAEFEQSLNPLQKKLLRADLRGARSAIDDVAGRPVGTVGKEGGGFAALNDIKASIQKRAKFSRGPAGVDDEVLGLKRQLAGVFRDELDKQLLPQLAPDVAKGFTESKSLYGALKGAERLAESGSNRAGGLGLKDLLVGAMGGNAHPAGMAAAVGSKLMRDHGPAIVANLAGSIAKSPALATIAESFSKQLATVAPKMGPYAAALSQAAQRGPANLLATHMAFAQADPAYRSTAWAAGLTPETAEEQHAALTRATDIATIGGAVANQDKALEKGVDAVFKGSGAPKPPASLKSQDFGNMRMRRDSEAAFKKRVGEIVELATNPDALLDRVAANAGELGNVAPGVVAAMTAQSQRAVQYLAAQAQMPPKAGPMAPEWAPSEAEREAFAEKLEVVEQPMSVLKSAASGTLTEGQIEALKAVYPMLYQDIANKMLLKAAENPKGMPYRARLMVGMLTGVDLDGSMSGEAIAANQAAIHAESQKQGSPGAPGAPTKKADALSLAERTALPGQRQESPGD